MSVRCKACGRSNLPVVPGSLGGAGELGTPVAHVHVMQYAANEIHTVPCWQGFAREEIIAAAEKMAEAIGIVQRANMFRMDL